MNVIEYPKTGEVIPSEVQAKIDNFKKPLQPHEIDWKIAAHSKADKNGIIKTTVVPYIDNRAVLNRLDANFGPAGWRNEFVEINGGFICKIYLLVNGQWVDKWDGASKTDIEPIKGGLSDAMKRAAHQWGLGRELYDYPTVQIAWNADAKRWIPNPVLDRLRAMTNAINEKRFTGNFVALTEDGKDYK